MKMSKFRFKGWVSTLLLFCFVLAGATGVLLFFFHGGMLLGLPRRLFMNIHNIFGLVMTAAVLLHFILNWRIYHNELKRNRCKK